MEPKANQRPLTDKEEAFALRYVTTRNATKSYRETYGSPETAETTCAVEGHFLTRRPAVAARIEHLTDEARREAADVTKLDAARLLRIYFDLAMADANELIVLLVGCCRNCHGEDHKYQWRELEYVEKLTEWENLPPDVRNTVAMPDIAGGFGFNHTLTPNPECPMCKGEGVERVVPRDTTQLSEGAKLLYQGVKKTRNGLEVVMADRTKMLENVGRMLGAFKDSASVSVSVRAAIQAVTLAAADPAQAQAAYMQMLEADGTNS